MMRMKKEGEVEKTYPLDPLSRIIGPLESRVFKELRFQDGVYLQKC
jgi:hypothetical protein